MSKKLNAWIKGLDEEEAKELLLFLVEKLDEVDQDDYFGTEGWRVGFGLEEEIP